MLFCLVGSGTHILPDTKIGNNVIIGPCTVITKDIPDNSVVAGVPARIIVTFDDYMKKYLNSVRYPETLKTREEVVSDELAEYMWAKFEKEHD